MTPRLWTLLLLLFFFLLLCSEIWCRIQCWKRPKRPGAKQSTFFRPFARIGRVINLESDQLGPSVFSEQMLKENIVERRTVITDTRYKIIQTDADAKHLLDINGMLSLQLQLGAIGSVAMQGAGSYLQDSGDRSTFAELLLVSEVSNRYQVLTNEEKHLTMAQCDKLKASGDTHLITGLEFGGQCIISVRVKINNNENRTDVEGELAGSLDIEKIKGEIKGSITRNLLDVYKLQNVTIRTYCNANLLTFPTNISEALQVARTSLNEMWSQMEGGVPMRMEVTPLTLYRKCRHLPKFRGASFMDIYLDSCAAMLNDARTGLRQLEECVNFYNLNANATKVKEVVMTALEDMRQAEHDMQETMRDVNAVNAMEKFKEFEHKYVAGKSQEPWNYRYWSEYAVILCNHMQSIALPPEETVDLALSPAPPINFRIPKEVVIREVRGLTDHARKFLPESPVGCKQSKGNAVVFRLPPGTSDVNYIKLVVPKDREAYLSGCQLFVSKNKEDFDKKEGEVTGFTLLTEDVGKSPKRVEGTDFTRVQIIVRKFGNEELSEVTKEAVVFQLRLQHPIELCVLNVQALVNTWLS